MEECTCDKVSDEFVFLGEGESAHFLDDDCWYSFLLFPVRVFVVVGSV